MEELTFSVVPQKCKFPGCLLREGFHHCKKIFFFYKIFIIVAHAWLLLEPAEWAWGLVHVFGTWAGWDGW